MSNFRVAKGPSTRVRIRVRLQFHAQFAFKPNFSFDTYYNGLSPHFNKTKYIFH
jgi:hypothetical protein